MCTAPLLLRSMCSTCYEKIQCKVFEVDAWCLTQHQCLLPEQPDCGGESCSGIWIPASKSALTLPIPMADELVVAPTIAGTLLFISFSERECRLVVEVYGV